MASSATSRTSATGSVNRLLGYVLGAVFLLIGALGFAVTGGVGFAEQDGNTLLGFEVNPLHNIVHLLVGIIGLFILNSDANILALNSADNVLHLVSAAALLGAGLAADKNNRR